MFIKFIKLSARKKKVVFSLLTVFFAFSIVLFLAKPALAQTTVTPTNFLANPTKEQGVVFQTLSGIPLGKRDPRLIIAGIVELLLSFLGLMAVVLMIYAGFVWMTSQGEVAKIQKARKIMTSAVVGMLIILSSYGIALYVIRVLLSITDSKTDDPSFNNPVNGSSSFGSLGSGIISSVYPVPNQKDVARNTSIIITFKETIDPKTICDKVEGDKCATGAKILASNVIVTALGRAVGSAQSFVVGTSVTSTNEIITDVYIKSKDNLTFVLNPATVLGSPDGSVWHSVSLSTKIKKTDGKNAFDVRSFDWNFEVSNKLDLTPPKVLFEQIFPSFDNDQDAVGAVAPAKPASAFITINNQPNIAQVNSVTSYPKSANSVPISVANPANNICDGQIDVVINNTASLTATVRYIKMSGKVDNISQTIVEKKLATACGFDIDIQPGVAPGMGWSIVLVSKKEADFIILNGKQYYFVNDKKEANQILVGSDLNATASNIASVLASDALVSTAVNANKVTLIAKTPGRSSNSLSISSSNKGMFIDPFMGGEDQKQTLNIKGESDQPRNAIIQINFNEAIDPTIISGSSDSLKDIIKVTNNGVLVPGQFVVSNQYKTVEFIPSEQCGTNGCGEPVYCLPANANLKVELIAAKLKAVCTANTDCAKYAPYISCVNGICAQTDNSNYPAGIALSGITDLASNSLDGNANDKAEGPIAYYNLNTKAAGGDNFSWSFWTSGELDITAPKIIALSPDSGARAVGLDEPILATFSKMMLASSLNSGQRTLVVDKQSFVHKLVNLRAKDNSSVAYWIEKNNIDITKPADGKADYTIAIIQHETFTGSVLYRPQIGSGVRDIYQNCFKPCASSGCQADGVNSSCCLGKPSNVSPGNNCP